MGLLSITRFNLRLLVFVKFVDFMKSSKVSLNVFPYFQVQRYASVMLRF